ncbi:MAG: ATP-binding cassette domain-containing protein [Elusimicrobia bacterium]|nr:ATP-binding cassette domain-containing protein [Elusimicrobiota bacterium]
MRDTVESITILGGRGKSGQSDAVLRIDLRMGDVASIVGPTGSGKTTLISDVELFADANTPTGRRILLNGAPAPTEYRDDPARNPIALITQHTTFLCDLPVSEFLLTHARIRSGNPSGVHGLLQKTLGFANQLTGEPIPPSVRMTELSGGQTRALLIADAAVICDTPIVLLDEVENAGIHRARALELLREHRKIFVFVTHDPHIALLSDYRIVMRGGWISRLLHTDEEERRCALQVGRLDDMLSRLRDSLRRGERVRAEALEGCS